MVRILAENTCRNSTPLMVDLLMSLAKSEASVSLSPERTAAVTDLVNNGYCERYDKYLAFNSIAEEPRNYEAGAFRCRLVAADRGVCIAIRVTHDPNQNAAARRSAAE